MCTVGIDTCIVLGGVEYCNVTHTWTPRVSKTWGLTAVIIPTVYSVAMFCYIFVRNYTSKTARVGGEKKTICQAIVDTYRRNVRFIYMKDYVSEIDYVRLTGVSKTKSKAKSSPKRGKSVFHIDGQSTFTADAIIDIPEEDGVFLSVESDSEEFETSAMVAKRYNNFHVNGQKIMVAEPLVQYKASSVTASSKEFKDAKKHRKLLGCIKLPRCCGMLLMTMKLIVLPIFAVIWDIVDVYFDTFYFYQLETGGLIHCAITRNTRVNNSILAFAVLGALKSTFFALCNLTIIGRNMAESKDHVRVIMVTMMATAVKILFEDGPEVILEYFYVDKFILDRNPPWYLVGKDIITALIYVLPLIKVAKSGYKDFKKTCKDAYLNDSKSFVDKALAFINYIPVTLAKTMISLALLFRVVGMIMQYSGGALRQQCLEVSDGSLVQAPFRAACMDWCDWCVLVFTGAALVFSFFPGFLAVLLLPFACC